MGDAVKVVFRKYAVFEGRASRSEFWYFQLFNVLVIMAAYFAIFLTMLIPFLTSLLFLALMGWSIVLFLPSLALCVRRLRDAGLAWGWIFLSLVPFGGIVLLVMWCQPSKYP